MMYYQVYLRDNMVYLPTMGMMDKGFYRGVEPVAVIPVFDTEALRGSLTTTIARGNPKVSTLLRREWPAPILLKYAGVKSWPAFKRGLTLWGIEERKGIWQIIGKRKKADGTTIDDAEKTISFPPGTRVQNVISRMVAILQQVAQR